MSTRISEGVIKPTPVSIIVNGATVSAYEGESLATALIAAGVLIMSRDSSGRARSPYCNMGVCFDCMVAVEDPTNALPSRVRACLTAVRPGLRVTVPEN